MRNAYHKKSQQFCSGIIQFNSSKSHRYVLLQLLLGYGFYLAVSWIILIVWVFAIPYNIPGPRNKRHGPLDTLKRRFASGEIGPDEYHERKKIIEID